VELFARDLAQGKRVGEASSRLALQVDLAETNEILEIKSRHHKPLWSLIDEGERYSSEMTLYEGQDSQGQPSQMLAIMCEGKGTFHYTRQGIKVHWQKEGTGPEHYFQSMGLGFWLEQQGVPCIHANALAINDTAIGILAPSQTGKTTLTMALMKAGMAMMSDDMMAVHSIDNEYRVYPGWPLFRVWPDTAKAIEPNGAEYTKQAKGPEGKEQSKAEELPRVHSRFDKRVIDIGTRTDFDFCSTARPLKHLYLLERREIESSDATDNKQHNTVKIESIKPAHALMHLLQNSMLGGAYKALGIEQQRLTALAKLLEQVPLKKVSYSSGMQHLPSVAQAILADAS